MKIAIRILIPLAILVVGYFSMKWLAQKKEEPAGERRRANLPRVRVVELRKSDFGVTITSQGVVRAHNSTSLTPRVSGRILDIREQFENGAFFKKDDVLVELDAADFDAALAGADARVARAQAALAQEQARAEQALLDWKDLGYTEKPSDLVLRKPQLKEAEADLAAADADRIQAQRDFDRSLVLAPYDGCVMRRDVGLGQSVGPSTTLGEIFSTDFVEVRLPLSASDLGFVQLPEDNPDSPVEATLFDALDSTNGHSWQGTVVRTEGALDETSRELFVITHVKDPYGLESAHPPLRVGQPVSARISGRILKDVFVLPREALRGPTEIVLVNPEESTLQRTEIVPLWSDEKQVVVRGDLPEGWLLVTSQMSYVANGAEVEILPAEESDPPKAAQSGEAAEDPGTTRPRGARKKKPGAPRG